MTPSNRKSCEKTKGSTEIIAISIDEMPVNRYNGRMEMDIKNEKVRVRVPATSANLGPGFDTLGIALNLYSYVSIDVSPTGQNQVVMQGEGIEYGNIAIENNIAWRAIQQLSQRLKNTFPPLLVTLENSIPLARGLGSSAAARVGAIVAANLWLQQAGEKHLDASQLLELATALERHPDNVSPAIFGGMTVSACDGEKVLSSPVNMNVWPRFLVFIPNTELATKIARDVLPKTVSRQDAIYNLSRLGLLIASLSSGNWQENPLLLKTALQDSLHQPYRTQLMPAFDAVQKAALESGALGVTLSGAGPSSLIWMDASPESTFKKAIESAVLQAATEKGISGKVIELAVDLAGCVVDNETIGRASI